MNGAGIIAKGDLHTKFICTTNDELELLGNAFNKMGDDLAESTKAIIYREQVKRRARDFVSAIQMNLCPRLCLKSSVWIWYAGLLPAEEVGGDCYDFIMKRSEQSHSVYRGCYRIRIPSAIDVSIANALFVYFRE